MQASSILADIWNIWSIAENVEAQKIFEKKGIKFELNAKISSIDESKKKVIISNNDQKIESDALIMSIGVSPNLDSKIIDNTKDKKFKINSSMMNLLGCSKENFFKLMNYMNYKKDKAVDTYIFKGERKKREKIIRFDKKENPFNKLLSLDIK